MQTPPTCVWGAAGRALLLAVLAAASCASPQGSAVGAVEEPEGRIVVLQHQPAAEVAFRIRAAHEGAGEIAVLELPNLNALLLRGDAAAVARLEREVARWDRPE